MSFSKVVIVAQQETLRERPRVHKMARILEGMGLPFEIWKMGPEEEREAEGLPIRNILGPQWRRRPPVLRYLAWMTRLFLAAAAEPPDRGFVAVGFDSALPISLVPVRGQRFIFDNVDNVAMSYRWPGVIKTLFGRLEWMISRRASLHTNPSILRWPYGGKNLRVITNTPARTAVDASEAIARSAGYTRGQGPLTLYVNGWLSPTRGLGTLVEALETLAARGIEVRVLVAGRPACPDADRILKIPNVRHLGMLPNAEALALYAATDLAFVYYDPSVEINRIAESQKWTDCWATGTPFVSNEEILTLDRFRAAEACFELPYGNATALADLIQQLSADRERLAQVAQRLRAMDFAFWDDRMRGVIQEWLKEGA